MNSSRKRKRLGIIDPLLAGGLVCAFLFLAGVTSSLLTSGRTAHPAKNHTTVSVPDGGGFASPESDSEGFFAPPPPGGLVVQALHEPEGDFIYVRKGGWMIFDGENWTPCSSVPDRIKKRFPHVEERGSDVADTGEDDDDEEEN